MSRDFVDVDWEAAIDVPMHIDAAPTHATMRGFLTTPVVRAARKLGFHIGREKYLDFREYPLREHLEVLVDGASKLYPSLSLRRGFREIAKMTLPAMRETTVGRVLLSLSEGSRGRSALQLVAKTYRMTRNVGVANIGEATDGHADIELREIHDFADSLHVGIFEHLLVGLGHSGRVQVRRHTAFDVDLRLHLDGG